jgi:hypothetical protein
MPPPSASFGSIQFLMLPLRRLAQSSWMSHGFPRDTTACLQIQHETGLVPRSGPNTKSFSSSSRMTPTLPHTHVGESRVQSRGRTKFTASSHHCAATVWGIARNGSIDLIPSNHSSYGHHRMNATSLEPGVNDKE